MPDFETYVADHVRRERVKDAARTSGMPDRVRVHGNHEGSEWYYDDNHRGGWTYVRKDLYDEAIEFSRLGAALAESTQWGREAFPQSTTAARIAHLRKELDELMADPDSAEEMADVAILLAGGLEAVERYATERNVDLAQAVSAKLAVLRTRQWGEPDADGVVEHVR